MELAGKLEVYLELQSSADYFFQVLGREAHKIPGDATDKIHGVYVHEGDWQTPGSIKQWSYTIDGKVEMFKEKVQIDEANKALTLTTVEGHVLDELKSYKVTLSATPKNNGGSLLTIDIDYEKRKPEYARPNKYLDLVITVVKDIDAHLANSNLL